MSVDGITIERHVTFPTSQEYDKAFEEFLKAIRELAGNTEIKAIGGGVPAQFTQLQTHIFRAPHLPKWAGKAFKEDVENAFNVPVHLENDSALVALGEAVSGAGKDKNIIAYLGIGTGVGGARIVEGRIDEKAYGFEPGHQILGIDKAAQTLEEYISGSGLKKRYGSEAREIQDTAVWEEAARVLAYGIYNTILHWSPEAVVLGGSVITGEPGISLSKVGLELSLLPLPFSSMPSLEKAILGERGGLEGALLLIHQNSL